MKPGEVQICSCDTALWCSDSHLRVFRLSLFDHVTSHKEQKHHSHIMSLQPALPASVFYSAKRPSVTLWSDLERNITTVLFIIIMHLWWVESLSFLRGLNVFVAAHIGLWSRWAQTWGLPSEACVQRGAVISGSGSFRFRGETVASSSSSSTLSTWKLQHCLLLCCETLRNTVSCRVRQFMIALL